jgi:protein-tyrosine phosphatase
MKTFVEKLVAAVERTELDLEYPYYDKLGNKNEVMVPYSVLNFVEAPSIDLDDAIKILTELKEKGANRVYIADHCDHHGYYFYGVKLLEI